MLDVVVEDGAASPSEPVSAESEQAVAVSSETVQAKTAQENRGLRMALFVVGLRHANERKAQVSGVAATI